MALVIIENTRFIFDTNFSGENDQRFHSTTRKGNVIIPDENQAQELIAAGFNVKQTKPREGEEEEFIPRYFVSVIANYNSEFPPKIWLDRQDGNEPVLLDGESVGILDKMWIEKVDVCCNIYEGRNGNSLYIKSMAVTQHVNMDPIAARYSSVQPTRRFDI